MTAPFDDLFDRGLIARIVLRLAGKQVVKRNAQIVDTSLDQAIHQRARVADA
ncbi:hypothetical protein [Paraburkholderia pallida]|uniref:hypothetical protein n=1 Tax=Paraburkholderia pallida TaxID=2547399 RepID=UPI0014305C39|nr:hypothetical protein [Paraburkholderia pallida]